MASRRLSKSISSAIKAQYTLLRPSLLLRSRSLSASIHISSLNFSIYRPNSFIRKFPGNLNFSVTQAASHGQLFPLSLQFPSPRRFSTTTSQKEYKERVHASINQKRVAAEKKRFGLLEAEKKKARAPVQQVRHVANSVSNQREMEISKTRDKLEDKLQRAKRHRLEFLCQRRRHRDSISLYCDMMQDDAVLLSRKLSRCWRCFVRQKSTTLDLAKAYNGSCFCRV